MSPSLFREPTGLSTTEMGVIMGLVMGLAMGVVKGVKDLFEKIKDYIYIIDYIFFLTYILREINRKWELCKKRKQ